MPLQWKIPIVSRAVFAVWRLDAQRKYHWIKDWLEPRASLLEVGSGPGSVVAILRERGHQVTALDIADQSFSPDLAPVVYDGVCMPFEARAFDAALILTTLHHTPDPDAIIAEARRVASRIIIIEDVYETRLQERCTKLADKLTNLEFIGHPHSNRSDAEWLATFERHGLAVRHRQIYPLLGVFAQAVYVLDQS